jgi:single-stranded-DNA-specific exonuclease
VPWVVREFDAEAAKLIAEKYSLSPLQASLLARVGLRCEDVENYLNPVIASLKEPLSLPGIKEAVQALIDYFASPSRRRVVVFGDYDCDGICASAILFKAFDAIAPGEISVFIPDRLSEGYGMSEKSVARMLSENPDVGLVVTTDNGICSSVQVDKLKCLGIDVIVTDHHLPDGTLPDCIVVNPKVSSPEYFSDLCGAGVALFLAKAFMEKARELGLYSGRRIGGTLVVMAGLATIGDAMPLTVTNRILVKESLANFFKWAPIGLKELFLRSAKTGCDVLRAIDYAFKIVPRINADGRLGSGRDSLDLLLELDIESARELSRRIDAQNFKRKELEKEMAAFSRTKIKDGAAGQVIVLENGHIGVIGIVAARIMDLLPKNAKTPVAVVLDNHGSVRAPQGYNVKTILTACAEFLEGFGGHAAAGGFTVKEGCLEKFSEAFVEACRENKTCVADDVYDTIDAWLTPRDITLEFAEWLVNLEPFGEGNPETVFAMKGISLADVQLLGTSGEHLQMKIASRPAIRAIWWRHGDDIEKLRGASSKKFDIKFRIEVSSYGIRHPVLNLIDIRET